MKPFHVTATRLIILFVWLGISFNIGASAGNETTFGSLSPRGPSFIAGSYEGYGFLYDRVEIDMLILWFIGLISFFARRIYVAIYVLALVIAQVIFVSQVNDGLLWATALIYLIPVEIAFLMASYLVMRSEDDRQRDHQSGAI